MMTDEGATLLEMHSITGAAAMHFSANFIIRVRARSARTDPICHSQTSFASCTTRDNSILKHVSPSECYMPHPTSPDSPPSLPTVSNALSHMKQD